MEQASLQERYAPFSVCFGCGPANERGLKIRSVVEGDSVVSRWTPRPYHHAFDRILSGGVISTVLDCHSNWTGAWSLMVNARAAAPPPTVTASIFVEFLRPTPMAPLLLEAHAKEVAGRKAIVESTVKAGRVVTATLRGTFVAVSADHPAAGRWRGDDREGKRGLESARGRGASGKLAVRNREEDLRDHKEDQPYHH